jgi:AraC-like DNA-binding protein
MNRNYLNANYTFTLGRMNFTVEIDDSLSAEYRKRIYPEPHKKTLHYHPMHEIFFVFDEGIRISYENDALEYRNSIVCLPPYTRHFTHRSADYRILVSVGSLGKESDGFSSFLGSLLKPQDVSVIPMSHSGVKMLLEELSDVFYNGGAISGEVVASALKLIFHRIYSDTAPAERNAEYEQESQYLSISTLVNGCTTPGCDVTVKTVAEKLHLSEKQVARIVKKYYGKSLSQVINEEKLGYASYLLTSTCLPISDVAIQSNFHSDNYFFQKFKDHFGVTPLQYRKNFARR